MPQSSVQETTVPSTSSTPRFRQHVSASWRRLPRKYGVERLIRDVCPSSLTSDCFPGKLSPSPGSSSSSPPHYRLHPLRWKPLNSNQSPSHSRVFWQSWLAAADADRDVMFLGGSQEYHRGRRRRRLTLTRQATVSYPSAAVWTVFALQHPSHKLTGGMISQSFRR